MGVARLKLPILLVVVQAIFLVLFAVFVRYDGHADATHNDTKTAGDVANKANSVSGLYPFFQDVHVMIFVGFGFLMTFLRRYGFSSVGLNFLVAAVVIQWSLIVGGFLHPVDGKILISIENLLKADFAAAAILITYGAVLGKTSPFQLVIIALVELVIFSVNEHIGVSYLKAVDIGGSMFVHTFGAYFGLALSRVIHRKDLEESTKEGTVYRSDVFAMIGTLFLWLFWPSFNSALGPGDEQHRAVINTYLALAACTVVAFALSSLVDKEGRFNMVHIQNSTLAGGVAVGTASDMMIQPWGALLIGCVAGALSVVGYRFITPFLNKRLKIHDTCGVHNLHGMPGVLAGIAGVVVAALATEDSYHLGLYTIFPARVPNDTAKLSQLSVAYPKGHYTDVENANNWLGRSAGTQALFQLLALVVTIIMAIVGGLLVGLLMRLPIFDQPKGGKIFDDGPWWETPADFEEQEHDERAPVTKKLLSANDGNDKESKM